eukprot:Rmarinus@m.8333
MRQNQRQNRTNTGRGAPTNVSASMPMVMGNHMQSGMPPPHLPVMSGVPPGPPRILPPNVPGGFSPGIRGPMPGPTHRGIVPGGYVMGPEFVPGYMSVPVNGMYMYPTDPSLAMQSSMPSAAPMQGLDHTTAMQGLSLHDQSAKGDFVETAKDCSCCRGYIYGCPEAEHQGVCNCSVAPAESAGGFGTHKSSPVDKRTTASRPTPQPTPAQAQTRYTSVNTAAPLSSYDNYSYGKTYAPTTPYGTVPKQEGGADDVDEDFEKEKEAFEREVLRDEWFPANRDCGCCNGYIYGCTNDVCLSLGVCGCTFQQAQEKVSDSASGDDPLGASPIVDFPPST